jgi:hypothetical protein
MKRIFFVLILVLASSAVAGVALAANDTTTSSPTATETPTGETTTVELSPTTRISEWRYVNGTFEIVIQSRIPTRMTLTDAGELSEILADGKGAASATVNQRSYNVGAGKTTIRFDAVTVDDNAAVTISAVNADGLAVIRTGAINGDRPPVDYETAQMWSAAAAIAAAGGTFVWVKKKREERQLEVEREW